MFRRAEFDNLPAADMHIHTVYCGHAAPDMTLGNIVRQAEQVGLKQIAITEHVWNNQCLAELEILQKEFEGLESAITVRLGAEVDVDPRYGRRVGWYALVRATRPKVIVETGVDRGLGTVVLAAAVARNAKEGCPGIVYATDIVPDCGHLLAEPYKSRSRILLGDSVESLKKFPEPVDIFLHDSDHRPEYEWAEFTAIEPRLHPASIVMSDNSQQSPKLREFAARLGRSYLYFQDQPRDHWWTGDGIGAAFVPGVKTMFQSGTERS